MAKDRQGPQVANPVPVPKPVNEDDIMVSLVREYARPEFRTQPNKEDLERANRVELQFLQGQIARQKDKIRRLSEEIEDEIKMLTRILNATNEQDARESIGNLKRRISRLKGALEFRGRDDYKDQ